MTDYKNSKKNLIHPWEKTMRVINVLIFIVGFLVSIIYTSHILFNSDKLTQEEITNVFLFGGVVITLIFEMGRQYGKTRAQSIKITKAQFPKVYEMIVEFSQRLELGYVPEAFVVQQGGVINAFAISFFSKKYISINSDIFEIAYLQYKDMDTLGFIIGHELAHLKRKHATTLMTILEFAGKTIPIWGPAQSRVKEYTCDRHGAWLSPAGKEGILILAAGKHLYKKVSVEEYLNSTSSYRGFFYWLYNLLASHPALPKRISAIMNDNKKGKVF